MTIIDSLHQYCTLRVFHIPDVSEVGSASFLTWSDVITPTVYFPSCTEFRITTFIESFHVNSIF